MKRTIDASYKSRNATASVESDIMSHFGGYREGQLEPVSQQAPIVGKCRLDLATVYENMRNAATEASKLQSYPGGETEKNHDVKQYDLILGTRVAYGAADVMPGSDMEVGVASLNGYDVTGVGGKRAAENKHYFVGVATGDSLVKDADNATGQAQGFGTLRAGTISMTNTGPKTFFPGDYIMWEFPELSADRSKVYNPHVRHGTMPNKITPIVVPFSPVDFGTQIAGAYVSAVENKSKAFEALLAQDGKLSHMEESGLSLLYGDIGTVLRGIEVLADLNLVNITVPNGANNVNGLAKALGLFSPTPTTAVFDVLRAINMRSLYPGTAVAEEDAFIQAHLKGKSFSEAALSGTDIETRLAKLFMHLPEIKRVGFTNEWYDKTNRVIGQAMSTSAPGEDLDAKLGHFTL